MGVIWKGKERIDDLVDETELSRYEVRLVDGLAAEKELELKEGWNNQVAASKKVIALTEIKSCEIRVCAWVIFRVSKLSQSNLINSK